MRRSLLLHGVGRKKNTSGNERRYGRTHDQGSALYIQPLCLQQAMVQAHRMDGGADRLCRATSGAAGAAGSGSAQEVQELRELMHTLQTKVAILESQAPKPGESG